MHQNGLSGTFFQFFVRRRSGNSQNFTFCSFWLGKMHQNCLSGTSLGFKACQIQCHRFYISAISSSWKITISGKKFTFCWFWLGKMQSKLFQWHIFRVQGMPNPMALLASLYNMWFMKNHNFWWHITGNGVQNIWKWDGTNAAVLLGAHFTPTPCFRTLYLDLPIKMQKNHNN